MEINNKLILTVKDISKILGIGISKAYKLVKTEGFPKIRLGRQIRIPSEAFYKWMNDQCNS